MRKKFEDYLYPNQDTQLPRNDEFSFYDVLRPIGYVGWELGIYGIPILLVLLVAAVGGGFI